MQESLWEHEPPVTCTKGQTLKGPRGYAPLTLDAVTSGSGLCFAGSLPLYLGAEQSQVIEGDSQSLLASSAPPRLNDLAVGNEHAHWLVRHSIEVEDFCFLVKTPHHIAGRQ